MFLPLKNRLSPYQVYLYEPVYFISALHNLIPNAVTLTSRSAVDW